MLFGGGLLLVALLREIGGERRSATIMVLVLAASAAWGLSLPMRNAEVSPWASFVLCAYPIIEVVYSMIRRVQRHQSASDPDRRHLHSLVATQIVLRRWPRLNPILQNSAVSVIMWFCAAVPALAAIAFHHHTGFLVIFAVACGVAYHFIYRRVART